MREISQADQFDLFVCPLPRFRLMVDRIRRNFFIPCTLVKVLISFTDQYFATRQEVILTIRRLLLIKGVFFVCVCVCVSLSLVAVAVSVIVTILFKFNVKI